MHTIKCDVPGCNREFSNQTQQGLNRVIGFHKAKMHGIPGKWNKEGLLPNKWRCKHCSKIFGSLPELGTHVRLEHKAERDNSKKAQARRAYAKQWREARKQSLSADESSHRAQLQQSAWWKVDSEQNQRQVWCPCCGANFAILQGSK